jgi:CubicO group peptidase (beta-lactamase class C family)
LFSTRLLNPLKAKLTMKTSILLLSLTAVLLLTGIKANAQLLKTLSGHSITAHELDSILHKKMDSLAIPALSFALINKGKIVYHRALGVVNQQTKKKVDDNSLFEAASLSKTVFAYFVLRMVDNGILNLDTPLYRYLPYKAIEKDPRYKLITARMVLCHTTGFPNWRNFDKRDTTLYQQGELYLKFKPGTQFAYSGEGYHYLAQVVAQLNHLSIKTLDSLFQKKVAVPLKLREVWFSGNPYVTVHKVNGYSQGKLVKAWPVAFADQDSTWFGAAGGLHTEAVSYAKFLIVLMKGKGLTKASQSELFKQQVELPTDSPHFLMNGDTAWGLGIAIKPVSYGTLYEHGGNNGNFQSGFKINKDNQNGYVFFVSCDQGNTFNQEVGAILTK